MISQRNSNTHTHTHTCTLSQIYLIIQCSKISVTWVCTDTLDCRSLLIRHKNGLLVQGQGAVTHWISEQQSRAMDPNIKKMCLNFTTFSLIEKGKMYYAHFYYCTALYSYLRIRFSALLMFLIVLFYNINSYCTKN